MLAGVVLGVVAAVAVGHGLRLSPYGAGRSLRLLAGFTAALGAWWLIKRVRPLGVLAAAALAAGIVGTDALAYHYTQRAPVDRIEALAPTGSRRRRVRCASAARIKLAPPKRKTPRRGIRRRRS